MTAVTEMEIHPAKGGACREMIDEEALDAIMEIANSALYGFKEKPHNTKPLEILANSAAAIHSMAKILEARSGDQ